jgi:YggT family protein
MLYSTLTVLNMLFRLLELTIFVECIASWVPQFQGNKFIMLVHDFINPILEPLRRLQDKIIPGLPMDFSPIIALVLLNILKNLVFGSVI